MTDLKTIKEAIKLLALLQLTLEQMDLLKGTVIYKQRVKNQMTALEKSIEIALKAPVESLDSTDDMLFTRLQGNIDMVLDMDTDELSMLRIAVEDIR